MSFQAERMDVLRFADDIVIMIESVQCIQRMLSATDRITEKGFNVRINNQNTETWFYSRNRVDSTRTKLKVWIIIQEMGEFGYLNSEITSLIEEFVGKL